ncbi:MAG: glycosyl transferase, partial [Clostridia bacterium]|nr:glycosyl transferase [Clostridia bacterium]
MENRLIAFVRNVGTGPKGARPLRYEEAYEAMVCLLE